MSFPLARTVKVLRYLPYWQAEKLACNGVINKGRKHNILDQRWRRVYTLTALAVASIFLCLLSQPPFPQGDAKSCRCITRKNPGFREPRSFIIGRRHAWSWMEQETVSILQVSSLRTHLWEVSLDKGSQLPCSQDVQKLERLMRIAPPKNAMEETLLLNPFL